MPPRMANARRHLDDRFDLWRPLALDPRPPRGWIRAVREALGMSTTELAARIGVSQSRVSVIEKSERAGALKLETLERVAAALDCRLVYALVPASSLEESVQVQAHRKAAAHVRGAAHHMLLEDQAVADADATRQVDELALDLVDRRGLWTDLPAGR